MSDAKKNDVVGDSTGREVKKVTRLYTFFMTTKLDILCTYRVTQNKMSHQTKCNFSTTNCYFSLIFFTEKFFRNSGTGTFCFELPCTHSSVCLGFV